MSPSKDTVGLHTFMQNRRTLFCYSGPMTEDLLTTIANPVRHQLSDKETQEAVANRVFGVFFEYVDFVKISKKSCQNNIKT